MQETREVRVGGYRWTITPGLNADDLTRVVHPSPEHERGVKTIVKHTPHRVVYRVQFADLDLHVKHYGGGFREWCRCLLRGRRAAREFALSREVARRGVPTLEILAYGQSAWRADSILVTRTMPEVVPLVEALEAPLTATLRQQLAEAIGTLLGQLHQAGVCHDDLHPGNLLLRVVEGKPRLYLIDLDMVRLCSPVGWAASRANLVVLDRWFALRFSRSDRLRAFRAYCMARPDLALDERQVARELAKRTATSLLRQTRKLDGRCLGGNRHFARLRKPGLRGYAVRDLEGLPDEATFARPDVELLKRSASSVVVELPEGRILKRVAAHPVAALFRAPPSLRSYRLGHAFRLRGLPTPRPLAVWRSAGRDYLLVEKVPDAVHLRGFVEQLATKPSRERDARLGAVLDELGRVLRRLHDWGFSHRDLKAANVLVSPAGSVMSSRGLREADVPGDHVWLIDLVGVKRLGKVSKRRRVRDLARLHVSFLDHPALSRTDRLRFLRAYLAWGLTGSRGWKGWWKAIDREGWAKARSILERGRVVG